MGSLSPLHFIALAWPSAGCLGTTSIYPLWAKTTSFEHLTWLVIPYRVEAIVDNNGVYTAYTTCSATSYHSKSFGIFQIFPTFRISNQLTTYGIHDQFSKYCRIHGATLYYRYDIDAATSICLVLGSHVDWYQKRLQETYRNTSIKIYSHDPFVVIRAIFAEKSAIFEKERQIRDRAVQLRRPRKVLLHCVMILPYEVIFSG